MATNAAHHARQVVENVEHIIAIELLAAAQGVDFRREHLPINCCLGKGTAAAYAAIRARVPFLEHDAPLYPLIEAVRDLVASGDLVAAVDGEL